MSGLAACSFWAMVGTGLLHFYPAMWTCFALTIVFGAIHQDLRASRMRAEADAIDLVMRMQAEHTAAAMARIGR